MAIEALRAQADAKAADLAPIVKELQAAGKTSLRAIAEMRAFRLREAADGLPFKCSAG